MSEADTAISILRLDTRHSDFERQLDAHLHASPSADTQLQSQVAGIIREVRERGDEGLLECVRRYDGMEAAAVADLQVPVSAMVRACERLDPPLEKD